MKIVVAIGILLTIAASSTAGLIQSDEPLTFYKKYLEVLAKAKSLDELLPYYAKELSDGLVKMPAEMKSNYLKMNKKALKDLKVTKQDVGADKAVYEMSATADGKQTHGKVTLVKQGGAWKIEDEAWALPLDGVE